MLKTREFGETDGGAGGAGRQSAVSTPGGGGLGLAPGMAPGMGSGSGSRLASGSGLGSASGSGVKPVPQTFGETASSAFSGRVLIGAVRPPDGPELDGPELGLPEGNTAIAATARATDPAPAGALDVGGNSLADETRAPDRLQDRLQDGLHDRLHDGVHARPHADGSNAADAGSAARWLPEEGGDPASAVSYVSEIQRIPTIGSGLATQHLLVVDDDDAVRNACAEIARRMGFNVHTADSVPTARTVLKQIPIDLLLLDMKLPGGGGLLLLEETKVLHPETAVVVMTAFATVSSAVEAMRIGAADYLTKPFALEELTAMLTRASQRRHFDLESRLLREKLRTQKGDGHIIGNSPEMEKLYRILSKVAFSTHPVLILGESGTGKEMVARSIHFNGPNARKPFVPVDCGSLVPTLIESELFGYVKGAFTGANRSKEGLLAAAEGGTVFLDEIGELPLDLQSKLLRALQEKEVRPVGATYAVPISARVLAATNRDLSVMVEQGKFRKDLYFRLNVVNLKIPPLRDRREDIPMLAQHFLERMQRETGRQHIFSDEALRLMTEFDWPGNVRELENAIERACALSSGPLLHMGDLPTQLQEFRMQAHQMQMEQRQAQLQGQMQAQLNGQMQANARPGGLYPVAGSGMGSGLGSGMTDTSLTQHEGGGTIVSIAELEKQAILNTIRQLNGDKLMAARLLQIGKTTLYRKLKEYGVAESAEEMN